MIMILLINYYVQKLTTSSSTVRCRYRLYAENYNNQTVYLPPTNAHEKVFVAFPGTSGNCTINISSSNYFMCNAIWSPITELDGTTNVTFSLKHYGGDLYSLQVRSLSLRYFAIILKQDLFLEYMEQPQLLFIIFG